MTTIKDMEEQRDEWVEKFEVLTKEFNDEREQWANRYRDLEEEKEILYGEMKEEIEKTQTELEGEKNNSQELGRFLTEIIRHEKQNGTNTELLQELLEEHRALLNTGQKYDHVEKRQKKRKLSILKSRAEKALSFVKSFGLNITSLTVESDAGERINLKMAYKTISDNDKTVIEKALFLRVNLVASLFLVGRAHWFAWIRKKKKKKWPRAHRYGAFSPFSGARTRPMQHVQLLRMLHSTGCVRVDLDLLHCSTLAAKLWCGC